LDTVLMLAYGVASWRGMTFGRLRDTLAEAIYPEERSDEDFHHTGSTAHGR